MAFMRFLYLNVKKYVAVFVIGILFSFASFSQGITTASEFFKSVSEYYGTIKDYQASVAVQVGKEDMKAKVTYLSPDKVRMDFSVPAEQTIVFNGDTLTVFLPGSAAVLTQNANSGNGGNIASADGLSLLRRYYSVSYENNQDSVPLDEDSDEMVVRLVLWRRTTAEAFRNIKLAINPQTKLIRRLEAITPAGVTYKFDFTNYELNQGLTAQRFVYDIPSAANNYDNFLFSE